MVYTQVGASIKETVRGLSRQIEVLGTVPRRETWGAEGGREVMETVERYVVNMWLI